jgi:hypothetical protein
MHVSRWDLETPAYEPGAWLRGTIYPQRCDLSPDGRWFAYFALKASAEWELGPTYIVISRLPWLTALAAWGDRQHVDARDAVRRGSRRVRRGRA